jgi:hypothetical protein
MSDQFDETLEHRCVYVPRGAHKDTIEPGRRLGLAVNAAVPGALQSPHRGGPSAMGHVHVHATESTYSRLRAM